MGAGASRGCDIAGRGRDIASRRRDIGRLRAFAPCLGAGGG